MLNERIGPETARFAVLGQSLPHTWSPYIHNSLFDAAGLDAVYLPVTVPPERLGSVTDVFRSCFSGFNVTIPYKEKILPFLDDVDEAARVCGAVNTVEIRNGRMIGHITDGMGMLRAIEERGGPCGGVRLSFARRTGDLRRPRCAKGQRACPCACTNAAGRIASAFRSAACGLRRGTRYSNQLYARGNVPAC